MKKRDANFLAPLIAESKAYDRFEDIEKLVESGVSLSVIPIQPLYFALKQSSSEQLVSILPRLSEEQRQTLLDLDLWKKDEIDVEAFLAWPPIYCKTKNIELMGELAKSEEFLLFIKARLNIYTFDIEDPEYPDHDNYFLTEDNQFLIEFDEDFPIVAEVKEIIKILYSELGVEHAYALLFKVVSESYSLLEEEAFVAKKERLRDYGLVDYYEALDLKANFPSFKTLENYMASKKSNTGSIDDIGKNQTLHSTSLVSYQDGLDSIYEELKKVTDEKRFYFLQFNFVKMVNGTLTLNDSLKKGKMSIFRTGQETCQILELGCSYVRAYLEKKGKVLEQGIFSNFEFTDIYKIGNSLIQLAQKRINQVLHGKNQLSEEHEYFLGSYWSIFIDNSFSAPVKFKGDESEKSEVVNNHQIYQKWNDKIEMLELEMPYILRFYASLEKLKSEGKLHDSFYLNYEVSNIDFESIIISSFINYSLGHYEISDVNKMGITISEFKHFANEYCVFNAAKGEHVLLPLDNPKLANMVDKFVKNFGLNLVKGIEKHLYWVLSEHISGYNYNELSEDDFRHVGGPIVLNYTSN